MKNEKGKLPIDYASLPNIKKLIRKITRNLNNELSENNMMIDGINNSDLNSSVFEDTFNSEIAELIEKGPQKPFKIYGFVDKQGRLLPIFRRRFMEIDPFQGVIRRFKKIEDFPHTPNEVISLKHIERCLKVFEKSINEDDCFEFIIYYLSLERYKVYSLRACNRWVDAIEKSIAYYRFIENVLKKFPKGRKYFEEMTKESIFLDINSGSYKKFEPEKGLKSLENSISFFPSSENSSSFKDNSLYNSNNYFSPDQLDNIFRNKRKFPHNLDGLGGANLSSNVGISSFEIIDTLGFGAFGKVYKVKLINTKEIYAMKVLNKQYLTQTQQGKYALNEIHLQKNINHIFVMKLHYSFQTQEKLYLILDYCPGGDLAYHLGTNIFEEEEAKFYIAELVLAIEYLHKNEIIYTDLKPENIFIDQDGHIKLADFGFQKEKSEDNFNNNINNNLGYIPPEMASRKGTGKSADIYGIGAVLYEMICGTPPFYADKLSELYNNVTQKNLMFPAYFSEDLKNLLKNLLCKDPKKRIGVFDKKEIMRHPFFRDINWDLLEKKELAPPLDLVNLKKMGENFEDTENSNFDLNINTNNNSVQQPKNKFTFIRPKSPINE